MKQLLALLAPHHDRARAVARGLARSAADGDDLFHEAVLRAHDHLAELRDPGKFSPWFYSVLLSVHRARHRRWFWRRLISFEELTTDLIAADDGPMVGLEAKEGASRMAAALATLPPRAREAIVLFGFEGFSIEEIAALQKNSVSAVKTRLVRARAQLRRHYERRTRRTSAALVGEASS